MADSILRLKVESQEYDNKLKRAAEGLQRYADGCRKAGGTLTQLDDGVEEFTRALGQMETVSKSAKGSVSELTKSFTDLSVIYNKLTDEEKNAPFGQALKSSLDEIKGRVQSGNAEIKNISESLNGGSGLKDALDQVAGKFGLNIEQLTKFGGVVGVATTALKVAKDAFMQSESNIDEWGRTVKGAEGAYDIFLQTLNNGNWSNFFSNLSQAITGARDLYDAFDRLNSIKANNAVAIATTQAEIQQLRLLKQQGQDVDDKLKSANKRLAALQSQSTNAGINAGKGQVVNTLRNGVNSIGGASINDATLKYAADKLAKDGQSFFDTMKRRAAALEQKGTRTVVTELDDGYGGTVNKYRQVFDINLLSKEQQKQYALAKTITERETEIQKGLSVWSQSVNEQASNAREQFRDNRYVLQGSGGGRSGGKSGGKTTPLTPSYYLNAVDVSGLSISSFENPFEKYKDAAIELVTPLQQLENELKNLQELQAAAWSPEVFAAYQQRIEEVQGKINVFKGIQKDADASAKSFKDAAGAVSAVGSALSSIEDPSVKIAGIVAQAVANIALAFSKADLKEGETGNIWYWIAATATGLASMITTISSIKAATNYASGGMIKGNSYSGDNLMAMGPDGGLIGLNAGEIVLNKAQTATLANSLQQQSGGSRVVGVLKGEDIVLMADRWGMRTGRGELLFGKNL